jgi:hypothetical protein
MTQWTTVADLVATVRKRWDAERYLRSYAEGAQWVPIELPVKAPSAAQLLDRFNEAVAWSERFHRDSQPKDGSTRFTVVYRTVKGKGLGSNEVPARARIDSFVQLCALLNTVDQVASFDLAVAQTATSVPELVTWVRTHPRQVIEHASVWRDLLATVTWIRATPNGGFYLRQIDVDGIDTKFVERHRKILDALLTELLPDDRIDARFSAGNFDRRFRFRSKPEYTRVRALGSESGLPAGLTEVTLRTDELEGSDLESRTLFVVENEITFLAFPPVPSSLAVFGSGFALASLRLAPWLVDKQIVYWGDLDTHGFDILSRLRERFDGVQSILMDRSTLLAHRGQWVREPSPTHRPLGHLSSSEAELYDDLVTDRFGPSVRLEQERVRFSLLAEALEPWAVCRSV